MSETKAGYVEGMKRTQSGNGWNLKLGGKWITVNNRSANLDGVEQGVYVEYQTGGFQGNNGFVPTVDRIRPAKVPAGTTPSGAQGGMTNRLKSAVWDDSALRFISNVVGCAIEAQKCATAAEVIAWATAAEQTLLSLKGEAPRAPPATNGSAPAEDPQGWDELAQGADPQIPW